MFLTFKQVWMRFAHFLGRINTAILLAIFYVLILGIVAILHRLLSLITHSKKKIGWQQKPTLEHTTEWASHLF